MFDKLLFIEIVALFGGVTIGNREYFQMKRGY